MSEVATEPGNFRRPANGPKWSCPANGVPAKPLVGWQSNGGPTPKHPDRSLPASVDVAIPVMPGQRLKGVHLVGVFAMHAGPENEPSGAIGASVLFSAEGKNHHTVDLLQARHYSDASDLQPVYRLNGDSTHVETLGTAQVDGKELRVDRLWIEVPGGVSADTMTFRDRGTPASFVLFDAQFEFSALRVCPFKGHGDQIALNEVGAIIRMRDRHRLDEALHQLCGGIRACAGDLDEARGLSLTFIATVVSANLEVGGSRSLHKALLEASRSLESTSKIEEIVSVSVETIRELTDEVVRRSSAVDDPLIDQALKIVARNFAKNINDENVAAELSLSTSHFRHLFRQATKQPFHRYMVNLRLEKARELLLQSDLPVSVVAESVGFQSPAHFSRAFVKRFGASPSSIRDSRR